MVVSLTLWLIYHMVKTQVPLEYKMFGLQSWFVHCGCGVLLCYCYSVHMMCKVDLNGDSFYKLI